MGGWLSLPILSNRVRSFSPNQNQKGLYSNAILNVVCYTQIKKINQKF